MCNDASFIGKKNSRRRWRQRNLILYLRKKLYLQTWQN